MRFQMIDSFLISIDFVEETEKKELKIFKSFYYKVRFTRLMIYMIGDIFYWIFQQGSSRSQRNEFI